jgi:hypothetical protein
VLAANFCRAGFFPDPFAGSTPPQIRLKTIDTGRGLAHRALWTAFRFTWRNQQSKSNNQKPDGGAERMLKRFVTAFVIVIACVTARIDAANISVDDIVAPVGAATVDIPLIITPSDPLETIGALNISFAVGTPFDAVEIMSTETEFDGSIWDTGESFIGVASTPSMHHVQSAVAMLDPLQVPADGIIVTYSVDASQLAAGDYELNPSYEFNGAFTTGDPNVNGNPTGLTFTSGVLTIGDAPPPALTGDYNDSGGVEQADLDLVLLNWGKSLADPSESGWINDIPTGQIDQGELDKVLLNWGDTQAALSAPPVPEPATWALSIAACLVLAAADRVRRRAKTIAA